MVVAVQGLNPDLFSAYPHEPLMGITTALDRDGSLNRKLRAGLSSAALQTQGVSCRLP